MDKIQLRDFVSLIETSLVTINGVDNFFAPVQRKINKHVLQMKKCLKQQIFNFIP